MSHSTKDYIKNKDHAQEMADNIKDWWHKRGYTQVKTWVEEDKVKSPYGAKLASNFYVRGNVTMSVASIPDRMID